MEKQYVMQIRALTANGKEWLSVRPTASNHPYTFETVQEALRMLNICYPDQVYGEEVRVIKL